MKWMLQRHAPLSITPDGTMFQLQWMWQMLRNCNADRYAVNKERMVRLAEYSRDCFKRCAPPPASSYEGRQQGTMQLFRTQKQFDDAAKDIEVLQETGVPFELLTAASCCQAEPAPGAPDKLVGGLRLPNDETGDCQLFTTRLATMAEANWASNSATTWRSAAWRLSNNSISGVHCGDELVNGRRLRGGAGRAIRRTLLKTSWSSCRCIQ
jgi:D-amino-acid dehydrogenase